MHVSNLFFTRPMAELAERLTARSIGGRVYFANSGAEANEAALKVVRKARPRGEIVVVHGGFHGRTYGALSATPQESKQAPFAPLVPGFVPVPPDPDAIAAAVHEGTAAVLLEVIQGESGVIVLPEEVLRAARAACDAVGAFLVLDEVQTGMGRTGTLWAYEQTGVVPDAITVAKALGGGLPIGALVCGERLAGVLRPGRPRVDVRRRPGRRRGRARRLRHPRRPGAAGARAGAGRAPARVAARAARRARRPRPRPHGGRRCRRRRAGRGAPRAARAAARDQRHRPRDAALPAAARARREPRRRRGGAPRRRAANSRR